MKIFISILSLFALSLFLSSITPVLSVGEVSCAFWDERNPIFNSTLNPETYRSIIPCEPFVDKSYPVYLVNLSLAGNLNQTSFIQTQQNRLFPPCRSASLNWFCKVRLRRCLNMTITGNDGNPITVFYPEPVCNLTQELREYCPGDITARIAGYLNEKVAIFNDTYILPPGVSKTYTLHGYGVFPDTNVTLQCNALNTNTPLPPRNSTKRMFCPYPFRSRVSTTENENHWEKYVGKTLCRLECPSPLFKPGPTRVIIIVSAVCDHISLIFTLFLSITFFLIFKKLNSQRKLILFYFCGLVVFYFGRSMRIWYPFACSSGGTIADENFGYNLCAFQGAVVLIGYHLSNTYFVLLCLGILMLVTGWNPFPKKLEWIKDYCVAPFVTAVFVIIALAGRKFGYTEINGCGVVAPGWKEGIAIYPFFVAMIVGDITLAVSMIILVTRTGGVGLKRQWRIACLIIVHSVSVLYQMGFEINYQSQGGQEKFLAEINKWSFCSLNLLSDRWQDAWRNCDRRFKYPYPVYLVSCILLGLFGAENAIIFGTTRETLDVWKRVFGFVSSPFDSSQSNSAAGHSKVSFRSETGYNHKSLDNGKETSMTALNNGTAQAPKEDES